MANKFTDTFSKLWKGAGDLTGKAYQGVVNYMDKREQAKQAQIQQQLQQQQLAQQLQQQQQNQLLQEKNNEIARIEAERKRVAQERMQLFEKAAAAAPGAVAPLDLNDPNVRYDYEARDIEEAEKRKSPHFFPEYAPKPDPREQAALAEQQAQQQKKKPSTWKKVGKGLLYTTALVGVLNGVKYYQDMPEGEQIKVTYDMDQLKALGKTKGTLQTIDRHGESSSADSVIFSDYVESNVPKKDVRVLTMEKNLFGKENGNILIQSAKRAEFVANSNAVVNVVADAAIAVYQFFPVDNIDNKAFLMPADRNSNDSGETLAKFKAMQDAFSGKVHAVSVSSKGKNNLSTP